MSLEDMSNDIMEDFDAPLPQKANVPFIRTSSRVPKPISRQKFCLVQFYDDDVVDYRQGKVENIIKNPEDRKQGLDIYLDWKGEPFLALVQLLTGDWSEILELEEKLKLLPLPKTNGVTAVDLTTKPARKRKNANDPIPNAKRQDSIIQDILESEENNDICHTGTGESVLEITERLEEHCGSNSQDVTPSRYEREDTINDTRGHLGPARVRGRSASAAITSQRGSRGVTQGASGRGQTNMRGSGSHSSATVVTSQPGSSGATQTARGQSNMRGSRSRGSTLVVTSQPGNTTATQSARGRGQNNMRGSGSRGSASVMTAQPGNTTASQSARGRGQTNMRGSGSRASAPVVPSQPGHTTATQSARGSGETNMRGSGSRASAPVVPSQPGHTTATQSARGRGETNMRGSGSRGSAPVVPSQPGHTTATQSARGRGETNMRGSGSRGSAPVVPSQPGSSGATQSARGRGETNMRGSGSRASAPVVPSQPCHTTATQSARGRGQTNMRGSGSRASAPVVPSQPGHTTATQSVRGEANTNERRASPAARESYSGLDGQQQEQHVHGDAADSRNEDAEMIPLYVGYDLMVDNHYISNLKKCIRRKIRGHNARVEKGVTNKQKNEKYMIDLIAKELLKHFFKDIDVSLMTYGSRNINERPPAEIMKPIECWVERTCGVPRMTWSALFNDYKSKRKMSSGRRINKNYGKNNKRKKREDEIHHDREERFQNDGASSGDDFEDNSEHADQSRLINNNMPQKDEEVEEEAGVDINNSDHSDDIDDLRTSNYATKRTSYGDNELCRFKLASHLEKEVDGELEETSQDCLINLSRRELWTNEESPAGDNGFQGDCPTRNSECGMPGVSLANAVMYSGSSPLMDIMGSFNIPKFLAQRIAATYTQTLQTSYYGGGMPSLSESSYNSHHGSNANNFGENYCLSIGRGQSGVQSSIDYNNTDFTHGSNPSAQFTGIPYPTNKLCGVSPHDSSHPSESRQISETTNGASDFNGLISSSVALQG